MKIIIHSIDELLELTALVRGGPAAGHVAELASAVSTARAVCTLEPGGLPTDIASPQAVVAQAEDNVSDPQNDLDGHDFPERDADGAEYSTDWHSAPKKLNADGRWRAKRGRDEAAYKWHLQAQAVVEAAIAADAEQVATETHALPQADGDESAAEPQEAGSEPAASRPQPASTVDLQALVAASQEAAMDAKDGLQDLLAGCRDFTSAHGTAEFNALKAAVAPRGDTGASLQEFTPGERRLMLACIANYGSYHLRPE